MVKKAVFFVKKGELKVETYTKDVDMKDDEVMIKVAYCGICGSDIHWLHNGELGPYPLQAEVYGHESSGTVTRVGPKVTSLKVGDRVCIEPFIPCTSYGCEPCKKGANNCCPQADSNAVTYGRSGFFRATNAWPEIMCHKLPENMSLEEGALVEPVACAAWSVKRSGLQGGNKVLVIGCGPIGLLCMMVAKAYGASKIIATDLNPKRLELASRAGADFSVLIDKNESPEAAAKRIVESMGEAPHVTLECTGSAPAINTGIMATRRGGKLALVGLGESYVRVALTMASLREVDLLGVTRYNNTFPDAIELLSSGKIDSKVIISHVMGLDEAQKAFKMLMSGEGVKILLKCNED